MKRYTLLVVFLALTACVAGGNALPAASTPASTTATAVATTEAAPTATATAALPAAATTVPTPLPTLDPTIERPDTPAPPLTPIPTATPAASGFVPPAPVAGFVDGLVLIPNDGSVIIYTPASGRVETLFGPNTYRLGSFDGPDPVWMPPRLSPDGRRLLLPRISDTWLAERAAPDATPAQATARPLIAERLWATWSPDSRRIVYTANSLVVGSQNPGAVYVQDLVAGGVGHEVRCTFFTMLRQVRRTQEQGFSKVAPEEERRGERGEQTRERGGKTWLFSPCSPRLPSACSASFCLLPDFGKALHSRKCDALGKDICPKHPMTMQPVPVCGRFPGTTSTAW
jgi:hypothetical protein